MTKKVLKGDSIRDRWSSKGGILTQKWLINDSKILKDDLRWLWSLYLPSRSATDEEVKEEDWLIVTVGGERHLKEETIANWRRYSVTTAPLKEGSSHCRNAVVGDLNCTRGAMGQSGAPAPLRTSRLSDHGPGPTLKNEKFKLSNLIKAKLQ